jgi:ABC-type branched-subunit amino acid transport system substrate-binding protein
MKTKKNRRHTIVLKSKCSIILNNEYDICRNHMRKRINYFLFAACFMAALLISPAYVQQGPGKTFKIGVISPLSGPLTFVGTSMFRRIEMAVKEIDVKGTLGNNSPRTLICRERYRVEIVNYDDNVDPTKRLTGKYMRETGKVVVSGTKEESTNDERVKQSYLGT